MTGKLFVGNLPWKTTEDVLADHFSQCGKVISAKIIIDRATNNSRGFGFVEMEDADKAIAELNGKELEGRALIVNEARAKN